MDPDYYDTKARVHELEKKIAFLFKELRIDYVAEEESEPEYMRHIRELLHIGNKIEAIKVYRENNGVGLGAAKTAVEAIERG
jgi:ribosomal protein L7/L12